MRGAVQWCLCEVQRAIEENDASLWFKIIAAKHEHSVSVCEYASVVYVL